MSRLAVFLLCLSALAAYAAEPRPKGKDAAADWPLFRRTAEQTGATSGDVPSKLEELWRFSAGDSIESAVAVADGVVFVASADESLYALDLATGARKWKFTSPPLVTQDEKTKKKKETPTSSPFKAPPAVRGGVVYVGDLDGVMHAIDAAKGERKWKSEAGGAELGGANFDGTDVLFGSHDEHLYSVDAKGKENWKFKIDGPIYGSVSTSQGKTFLAGCDSQLHVIDVKKGKPDRSIDLGGQSAATGAVAGDVLYVGTMKNEVRAVDWKKGETVWTYKPGRNAQAFYSSPAVSDKYVVIGNRDGKVHCIDRKTGEGVWKFSTDGKVDSSPVVAGARVVVGSLDQKLYVIDLASGREVTRVTLDAPVVASPVVVAGRVLIGTQKGTLYCLGKK